MKHTAPNFLTCPALPELPPPGRTAAESRTSRVESQGSSDVRRTTFGVRRKKWRLLLACAGMLCFVSTIPLGVAVVRAGLAARDVRSEILRARAHAAAFEFEAAKQEILRARASMEHIRSALHTIWIWRHAPGIGAQFRAVEETAAIAARMLDGVAELAEAAAGVLEGIEPSHRLEDLSTQEKRDVINGLARALPKLRHARDNTDLAFELWSAMPQDRLIKPLRLVTAPVAETLPFFKRMLDQLIPIVEIGAPLAGAREPLRALILLQNADELRPAGGFIGTIGTITMDAGELTEFDFRDIYHIDRLVETIWKEVPPKPIAQHLGIRSWFLRDANWSPDFPSSAERALDYYVRERSLAQNAPLVNAPTTVIAFEPGFFSALLALTGPLTVDGKLFTAENFFERLEYEVEIGFAKQGIPVQKRKELVERVGAALLERLKTLPLARWSDMLDLVTSALRRKQIMFYSQKSDLLSLFDARGWTGRAQATNGDFLWVVDANLAALKTDGVMEKRVAYKLDARDSANLVATVALTYTNTARAIDWRHTRYRSYTRVYVPEGSELLEASDLLSAQAASVEVMKELGKTVFGAFWSIEPGQTKTLRMKYRLPPTVSVKLAQGFYRLDWPKQPGADTTQLTVNLLFDKKLLSATPAEDRDRWGDAKYEYKTDSLEDRKFELTF